MNADVRVGSSGGIGFCGLLTIVFIALKLTGVIGWSWIWVLSPLWIGFALTMAIIIICLIVLGAKGVFEHLQWKK